MRTMPRGAALDGTWPRLLIIWPRNWSRPSKSYKSLGLLPQLRRQAVGPDSQGEGAEGLALGNPERILRAMKRWESVGVDRINFLLNCMEEIPQEQVLKSLQLFAREVMPHFQHPAIPAATPVGSAAQ